MTSQLDRWREEIEFHLTVGPQNGRRIDKRPAAGCDPQGSFLPSHARSIHGQTVTPTIRFGTFLLNADETARHIACELVASERKVTAVCLACCCKSFEDPVLDALRATQFGSSPSFECFPGDVWNEGGYAVSAPTTCGLFFPIGLKVFKQFPTAMEWAHFRKCVRRTRELRE